MEDRQRLAGPHTLLNTYIEGVVTKGKNSLPSASWAVGKEDTGQLVQDRCAQI